MNDRLPPHSEEHERKTIGGPIINRDVIDDVREIVRHEDFYSERNREIFAAIESLDDRGAPLDAFTITEELRARGRLDAVENGYLAEIADAGVPSLAIDSAHKVKAFAELRQLEFQTRVINRECFETIPRDYSEFENFKDGVAQRIFDACESRPRSTMHALPSLVDEAIEQLDTYDAHEIPAGTIPIGLTEVQALTGGLEPETVSVLAARPSMGKTALLLHVAEHAAESGHAVVIFSLEMSKRELTMRLICSRACVNLTKAKAGNLTVFERERVRAAAEKIRKLAIQIDDGADQDLQAIRSKSRRLARRGSLGLIIADYLQLIRPRDLRDQRERQISEISRGLKRLEKELHVPVLVASQLNRLAEARKDHKPQLSDLRESGAIEQDADNVFLLHRPEFYDHKDRPGKADLIIAKQRNGPRTTIPLRFTETFTRFDDIGATWTPPAHTNGHVDGTRDYGSQRE